MTGQTLFEKVWQRNVVSPETAAQPAILHVGLHLVHEVTSPQAFAVLKDRRLKVRRSDLTLATMDHSTPTLPPRPDGSLPYATKEAEQQVATLRENCAAHGIELLDFGDARRGIVHMVGPELGRTHPGMVIVCGDSHTSTHGAFGALAFGIGTTEVGHVLATQCLFQRKPKTMRVRFEGQLTPGVTAKDMALAFIAHIGAGGATGHVIEYAGPAVEALDMEARMTLCNLSIEAGARAGMIAPDDVTIDYIRRRDGAPADFEPAAAAWRGLRSDPEALFDRDVKIDASSLTPMATYGTSPDQATGVAGVVPAAASPEEDEAYSYMGVSSGQPLGEVPVDKVFIGSCTNGRLSDLRAAASILSGRQVSQGVQAIIVPGSEAVRREAEAEGLDQVFLKAGAEWRLPGCSMCIAMNGDRGEPGETIVSTSNRNFRGRQGKGVRTILASPLTAAASAVSGRVTDPRDMMRPLEKGAAA